MRIKSDPALAAIPVVILTGLDDDARRRAAMLNGESGYTIKPTEPRHFLRAVMSSVSRWVGPPGGLAPGPACRRRRGGVGKGRE